MHGSHVFYMNWLCSGFILLVMFVQLSCGICVAVLEVAFFVTLVLYSPAVSYSNCKEIAEKVWIAVQLVGLWSVCIFGLCDWPSVYRERGGR